MANEMAFERRKKSKLSIDNTEFAKVEKEELRRVIVVPSSELGLIFSA